MVNKFCPVCGKGLVGSSEGVGMCPEGHYMGYDNPKPVVVGVVSRPILAKPDSNLFEKNRLGSLENEFGNYSLHEEELKKDYQVGVEYLLIKRGVEPKLGGLAFPAGFVEKYEDPKDAVLRELKEETGLEGKVKTLIDAKNPMPGKLNQILMFYKIDVKDFSKMEALDDAEEVLFKKFYWKDLDPESLDYGIFDDMGSQSLKGRKKFKSLAFDSHADLISELMLGHVDKISKRGKKVHEPMNNYDSGYTQCYEYHTPKLSY